MKQTILIVDDCSAIATIIARHLESAGYRTLTAASGVTAREILARTTPDLVMLDLLMPDMSGTELLHGLRHDPATAHVPVILVSARVGHHGTHVRSTFDADYSVGKPFTRHQILAAVRTVLARKASPTVEPPPRVDARARIAAELGLTGSAGR